MTQRVHLPRFAVGLGLIAVVALAIRIGAAYWYDANIPIGGDAIWYDGVARYLSEGRGFLNLWAGLATGHDIATAAHPPLFPSFLAVPKVLGWDSTLALRLWCTVPGTLTVVMVGLLARDLAGEAAGLLAAAFAAVFVDLWAQDVLLWSEGVFAFLVVSTVYASYRFVKRPDFVRAMVLGGAITLLALTRAEGVVLYLILLAPLVLRARGVVLARRLGMLGAALGVGALLFTPWIAYNAQRFEHPVLVSTGLGGLLVSSNCPVTYGGPERGGWGFVCLPQAAHIDPRTDETVTELRLRRAGITYAREHASRLAIVIPFRLLRSFGFYKPFTVTAGDLALKSGRSWMPRVAMIQYWSMLPLGVVGAVALRRRRVRLLPFLDMVAVVATISVIGYGTMRFRIALDAVLPVLAATGVVSLWRLRGGSDVSRTSSRPVQEPRRPEPVADAAR